MITHITHVVEGSALVIDVHRPGTAKQVTTFQGNCECGWKGPRRTARWEATDDIINHKKFPEDHQ